MGLLKPDQYMDLLQQRCADEQEHVRQARAAKGLPPLKPWVKPTPDMMVRDGDEHLIDPAALDAELTALKTPAPRRTPKPRTYRSTSSIRAEIDTVERRMASLDGLRRHDTDDPAAYGGIGVRQTPRQRRQYAARLDRTASEYVSLERRRAALEAKLQRAQAREGK